LYATIGVSTACASAAKRRVSSSRDALST
jgi:hypothetical protein